MPVGACTSIIPICLWKATFNNNIMVYLTSVLLNQRFCQIGLIHNGTLGTAGHTPGPKGAPSHRCRVSLKPTGMLPMRVSQQHGGMPSRKWLKWSYFDRYGAGTPVRSGDLVRGRKVKL
jgi:hypothetical protein